MVCMIIVLLSFLLKSSDPDPAARFQISLIRLEFHFIKYLSHIRNYTSLLKSSLYFTFRSLLVLHFNIRHVYQFKKKTISFFLDDEWWCLCRCVGRFGNHMPAYVYLCLYLCAAMLWICSFQFTVCCWSADEIPANPCINYVCTIHTWNEALITFSLPLSPSLTIY